MLLQKGNWEPLCLFTLSPTFLSKGGTAHIKILDSCFHLPWCMVLRKALLPLLPPCAWASLWQLLSALFLTIASHVWRFFVCLFFPSVNLVFKHATREILSVIIWPFWITSVVTWTVRLWHLSHKGLGNFSEHTNTLTCLAQTLIFTLEMCTCIYLQHSIKLIQTPLSCIHCCWVSLLYRALESSFALLPCLYPCLEGIMRWQSKLWWQLWVARGSCEN